MSNESTVLKEKIAQVQSDLERVNAQQGTEKQRMVMQDYLDYLKDELSMLERNNLQKPK
jgi:hypothetical protein